MDLADRPPVRGLYEAAFLLCRGTTASRPSGVGAFLCPSPLIMVRLTIYIVFVRMSHLAVATSIEHFNLINESSTLDRVVTDIAGQLTFSILDIENVARMIGAIAADLVSMGTPV